MKATKGEKKFLENILFFFEMLNSPDSMYVLKEIFSRKSFVIRLNLANIFSWFFFNSIK